VVKYIPKQGDIVALNFNPQSGHEQKGRRPAIIISNKTFNQHLGRERKKFCVSYH